MFSCFQSTASPAVHNTCKRKQEVREETTSHSRSVSRQMKDVMVRVVHAGGRVEMYHTRIRASELIRKYPDFCITTPQVFNCPQESVLTADDVLLPGQKYFLMRRTSVEKLKRRHSARGRARGIEEAGDVSFEESTSSAQELFVSTERRADSASKKSVKEKRPFVPPIQKPKLWKESDWEPSLDSIQELSP
ncbi:beta-arabinofuranosyltransferase RAY1 isoform X1 [Salvia divinorum]|uniref:Beta-arabinofuranosyltransferase RAY1 isoform X1 n=1 Tax=Salvia divinorum TaxID=28513 RepID=A0ABD1ICP4_SALDI